jgi:hypothetical protein
VKILSPKELADQVEIVFFNSRFMGGVDFEATAINIEKAIKIALAQKDTEKREKKI